MKVSVIVPVYNAEKYIVQCLESIVNQTLKDIEILLVDDSSTDGSLDILRQYQTKDNRIRIIENVHEGDGAASARNAGLREAQGEYLLFLDADDDFDLQLLEKTYAQAKATDADVVLFDGLMFQSDTGQRIETGNLLNYKNIPQKEVFNRYDFPDAIFTSNALAVWVKLFRRAFIIEENLWFEPVFYTDDLLFVGGALATAKRMTCLPEKLVYYRIGHTGTQTKNRAISPLSSAISCVSLKELLQKKGVFQDIQNGYANSVIKRCAWNLNTMPTPESFTQLYHALATEFLEKLELKTSLTKNMLPFDAFAWMEAIQKNDAVAYGFCGDDCHSDDMFFKFSTINHFPKDRIEKNAKVVLYGAGKVGKSLFVQNLLEGHCEIVAWIDAEIEEQKPPLSAMADLVGVDFDVVLISVRNDRLIDEVKARFVALGKVADVVVF